MVQEQTKVARIEVTSDCYPREMASLLLGVSPDWSTEFGLYLYRISSVPTSVPNGVPIGVPTGAQ